MPRPALSTAERDLLRTRDLGFGADRYHSVTGAQVLAKEDPILAQLASSDEREYDNMERTSHAIGGALNQRRAGVLEAGSRLVPSERSTPAARRLADFGIAALKSIRRFRTTRKEMLSAVPWGWRPALVEWDPAIVGGATWWLPVRITPLRSWRFQVSVDDSLVQVEGRDAPRVFDQEIDRWRFFRATAGAVSSPYGESVLRGLWIVYFLQNRFQKLGWHQIQRSLGIIKASKDGGAESAAGELAKVDADLSKILRLLNSSNILAELGGWKLAVETIPDVVRNTTELNDYWNRQIRISLVGQNLTSEVKGGSYAAARQHGDVLHSIVAGDAAEEEGWWNDGLLNMAFELNFGAVDLDDVPRWRNLATNPQTDIEWARAFVDMGGELDARRLADRLNLPMAMEDSDGPRLVRSATPTTTPPPARAVRSAAASPPVHAAEEPDEDPPGVVLGRHYDQLLQSFRERNPDPKAPGRPSGPSPKPAA